MNAESSEREQMAGNAQETPLCLRCFHQADPRAYYCPHCGEATGQLVPCIPFVNIPWQAGVWGQAWRQVWFRDVSIPGRIFRLLMILWQAPILLIVGLPVMLWRWDQEHPPTTQSDSDDKDESASD